MMTEFSVFYWFIMINVLNKGENKAQYSKHMPKSKKR